jgi:hypothetical protein
MKPGALPRGNLRLPATARTSRRTATRALHARAQPSSRALRPSVLRARDFLAQPSQQPAYTADTQTAFAQHILPSHRTTHLPRSSPPRGPCPPSPDRGSAPPPPSRRPDLPINLCAICPAVSICAQAADTTAAHRPRIRTATLREAAGTSPSASARAQALMCRDVLDARAASHMLAAEQQQQTSADSCSASCVGTSALQHTCTAGTHALQHTLGRCNVAVDLYSVPQERVWDGHRP